MADGRTPEQIEHDAEVGKAMADTIQPLFEGAPISVLYNVLGNLVETVFTNIEFEQPQDALIEFDAWTAYTRERIAEEIKGRLS